MPLHAQCKAVLDQIASQGGRPMEEMTPAEVREDRARNAEGFAALAGPAQAVARVEDRSIPGPGGPIPVRVYWPELRNRLPVYVYFHGGGWVFGNIDAVDRPCRAMANAARCIVVNVEYRLAPESKYPAAAEDAFSVIRYVADHAAEFEADPDRMAVGGDSAGGNLAAVACLMARERGGPRLSFQLLIYPVTDYDDNRPSMQEYAEEHLLTRSLMGWFWGHYVATPEEARHPNASPLNATSLAGLPPAMVITAECDPIRDQGEAYAWKLREDGVPVTLRRYEGAIHAFFQMAAVIDSAREAQADAAGALREAFSRAAAAV